jgi:hypothetical protein
MVFMGRARVSKKRNHGDAPGRNPRIALAAVADEKSTRLWIGVLATPSTRRKR